MMHIFKWGLQLSVRHRATSKKKRGGKKGVPGRKCTFWLALKKCLLAASAPKFCWFETRRYKLSDQQPWRWQHWSPYQGSAGHMWQHYLFKPLLLHSLLHQSMGQHCWELCHQDLIFCFVVLSAKWKISGFFFATSPALKIDIFWFVLFNEEKNVVVSTALLGSQCQKPMSTFR